MIIGVRDLAGPEGVVDDHQPTVGEQRHRRVVVVDVVRLVRVDEDEVERPVEPGDRLERGAEPVVDAIVDSGLFRVAARDRRRLLVHVTRDDPAAGGKRERHRDGRVAGEGPELEHAAGAQAADERAEETALEPADHHLRRGRLLVRLRGETFEELAVG